MSTNAEQGVAVKLRVVFHRSEDGPGYWAEVPGFPGCLTEGDTLDEARADAREAFAGILAAMQARGETEQLPGDVTEDVDLRRRRPGKRFAARWSAAAGRWIASWAATTL